MAKALKMNLVSLTNCIDNVVPLTKAHFKSISFRFDEMNALSKLCYKMCSILGRFVTFNVH